MNELLRFSDYDVFAYLATGLAALAVADLVCGTAFVLGASWTVASAAITIAGAYVLGQILASPAAWIVQDWATNRVLLRPTIVLMESRPLAWRRSLKRSLLGAYYAPLNDRLQAAVREVSRARWGKELVADELFWCAFAAAKTDPITYARMESFLKLYGFCRNVTFVALCGAVTLAGVGLLHWCGGQTQLAAETLRHSGLAFLVGAGMFHRYLKFYRAYAQEVLVSFATKDRSLGERPTNAP